MTPVSVVLLALALLTVLALIALLTLYVRRYILQRDGGFDMCVRSGSHEGWAGGWTFGLGRYRGECLEWFRTFSFLGRPKWTVNQSHVMVSHRRTSDAEEDYELPAGHVVLVCDVDGNTVEVSMTEASAMAFSSWLEAAPPGEHIN